MVSNTTDMLTVNATRAVAAGVSELADAGGPWSAPAEVFECLAFVLLLCILAYAIGQTRMLVRLIRLLRQPARIAQFGLAESCVVTLCFLPGIMLLILAAILVFLGGPFVGSGKQDLLTLMTFRPIGSAFSLGAWVLMTAWFRHIVRRDLAIYREPIALVPVVNMSLICLTYIASGFFAGSGMLALCLLIYIPAAPLAGFVLLIVHVWQVRAAKTWETYVPPEEEEMP
jgi:hypothetical protein